ncbi:MAG: hypothetical protein ACFFB3_09185 [Candidatus Hodarchaeota archaeon]
MTEKVIIQDKILYKPILFKTLTPKEYKRFFFNNSYYFIISLLKGGYLTVNEIHENYPPDRRVKEQEIKEGGQVIKKKVEIEKKKSENTIYRYIQELLNVGILSEAGRRIQSNQISTKILYCPSAKFILINNDAANFWRSERGQIIANTLRIMLNRHFNEKIPELSSFIDFLVKIEENCLTMQKDLLEQLIVKSKSVEISQNEKQIHRQTLKAINDFTAEEYLHFQLLLYDLNLILFEDALKERIHELFAIRLTELVRETESKPSPISKSQNDSEFHDVILYHPPLIKVLTKEDWDWCFNNPNYGAVTEILKEGPMTIKEIHGRHHAVVIERIKRKQNTEEKDQEASSRKKQKSPRPKKENTVYRYVKDLIKAGFVAEAGRRILPNQTYTPLLYSRIARVYVILSNEQEFLKSKKGKNVTTVIGQLLQHYLHKRNVDQTKLGSIILDFDREKKQAVERSFYSETIGWISDAIFSLKGPFESEIFHETLKRIEWLISMKNKKDFELLSDCFFD